MADYRFLLTDVRTRKVLSDAVGLRLSSYARRLCRPTNASAELLLSDPGLRALTDPVSSTEPRRTALWVIRDGLVVWGGIIWSRRYRSGDGALDLGISSFESYLARRRIRRDYGFRQWDQHDMLANLVQTMQREPHDGIGDVGIEVPVPPKSGVLRDRDMWWHERATYLERMQQLAEVQGGPDWTFEPGWAPGGDVPWVTLLSGTPLGDRTGRTVLDFPGLIRNYSWPDDGGNSANYWTAIGEPEAGSEPGTPPQMRDASMSAEWAAGVPLLEDVSSHQGVTDPWTLQYAANANVVAAAGNRVAPEITTRLADGDRLPGLGDVLTVSVADEYRFPPGPQGQPGIVAKARVTGWTVYLSADQGETVSLVLGESE